MSPSARRPVALPGVAAADGARRRPRLEGRGLLAVLLAAAFLWSLLQVGSGAAALRTGGLDAAARMAGDLLRPDLGSATLARTARAAWTTLVYAVAGMTLALAAGAPLGLVASGTLAGGAASRRLAMTVGRGVLAALRSVHELVWAWLLVVALGLSPLAAVLAIAIPYAGVLGRIYADLLNDVPDAPLRALAAAGGGRVATLFYGRLPMALPDMTAYTFYRFECALRASAVMGFVGLGGLGFEIQMALQDLGYREVATHLLVMVALIAGVEAWSGALRRELAP